MHFSFAFYFSRYAAACGGSCYGYPRREVCCLLSVLHFSLSYLDIYIAPKSLQASEVFDLRERGRAQQADAAVRAGPGLRPRERRVRCNFLASNR